MLPQPPRIREPILNLPPAISLSLLALVGIHLVRLLLEDGTDFQLIVDWGVVPARWSVAYGGVRPDDIIAALAPESRSDEIMLAYSRYVLGGAESDGGLWTALTYAFLHGSWAHLLINSVWLAAFGTPMVRRCGAGRFLLLSAASAIGGAVLYAWMNPNQLLPMIGASGAVSGLMAAASWFMFAPATWHPAGRLTEPHERPRQSLGQMVRNRQVLVFLAVWFAANYVFAFLPAPGATDANIAWEAHIGGFLVGLAIFPFLDPLRPRPRRVSA
jgi:membrane associated rhomboid family serine protease